MGRGEHDDYPVRSVIGLPFVAGGVVRSSDTDSIALRQRKSRGKPGEILGNYPKLLRSKGLGKLRKLSDSPLDTWAKCTLSPTGGG